MSKELWIKGPFLTLLLGCVIACPGAAVGGDEGGGMQTGVDANGNLDYFSPRLGARFCMQDIKVPGFGKIRAARITSRPEPGSPLSQLGLRSGDVITRLDGTPVTRTEELERHIIETDVRYIKSGGKTAREGQIYIDPNTFFEDPQGGVVNGNSNVLPP